MAPMGIHPGSVLLGAILATGLIILQSTLHLSSPSAMTRRSGHLNPHKISLDEAHALHEVTSGDKNDIVVETDAALSQRPHKEHIEALRDPLFHKEQRHNWTLQGYSRPYLRGEREVACVNPKATEKNLKAVRLVREIIDDPLKSTPADLSEPLKILEEAMLLDAKCLTLRLNMLMIKMAEFSHLDRRWLPAELAQIDGLMKETVQLANEFPSNTKYPIAKVHFWAGILEELKTNTSASAQHHFRHAIELDPALKEEHIHPTQMNRPQIEILRNIYRPCDFWFRRALVQILFYYEYAPATGAYTKITYADTQRFLRDWHVKLDGALPPYVFAIVARVYRIVIDNKLLTGPGGAYKGSATHESNGDCVNTWYNIRIAELVSRLAGTPVKPTYGYTAGYLEGDVLKPHTDRKACEFTLTTLIEAYPHTSYCPLFVQDTPWPIDRNWVGRFEENTIKYEDCFNLHPQLNQWLILRGRAKPHFRPAIAQGATCTTFLSHFVPVGEPEQ